MDRFVEYKTGICFINTSTWAMRLSVVPPELPWVVAAALINGPLSWYVSIGGHAYLDILD